MTDSVADTSVPEEENLAIAVPHAEFVAGLPLGRYRLIINPKKAERYVKHRLFIMGVTVPMIGVGIALALTGYAVIGVILGAIGIAIPRIIKHQAGKILLHLVTQDAKTYYDTIEYEILEVRHSRD